MKDYKIFRMTCGELYVIILSDDMEKPYWNEMKEEISSYASENSRVWFDFYVRNGFRNRYFSAVLNGTCLRANSLKRSEPNQECINISDQFFSSDEYLLDMSGFQNYKSDSSKHYSTHENEAVPIVADLQPSYSKSHGVVF